MFAAFLPDILKNLQHQVKQLSTQLRSLEGEVMQAGRELRKKEVEAEEMKTEFGENKRVRPSRASSSEHPPARVRN